MASFRITDEEIEALSSRLVKRIVPMVDDSLRSQLAAAQRRVKELEAQVMPTKISGDESGCAPCPAIKRLPPGFEIWVPATFKESEQPYTVGRGRPMRQLRDDEVAQLGVPVGEQKYREWYERLVKVWKFWDTADMREKQIGLLFSAIEAERASQTREKDQ